VQRKASEKGSVREKGRVLLGTHIPMTERGSSSIQHRRASKRRTLRKTLWEVLRDIKGALQQMFERSHPDRRYTGP